MGRVALRLGLFELQTEIRFVEARQRIAVLDQCARVGETLRHFARDAKGEIAFDARLDDARQDLLAFARDVVNLRDQHGSRRGLSARLLGRVAGGEEEGAEGARDDEVRLHGAFSPAIGEDGSRSGF